MQYVDDTPDTLTDTFWHELTAQTLPTPASSTGRLSRWFGSLAASMSLHGRTGQTASRRQPILTPADIVAQNYPQLYLQIMCG